MSAFDIKPISEQDAFKLEVAKGEEAQSERNSEDAGNADPSAAFTNDASPVAEVVEQIMSHWAEADETSAQEAAEASGDDKLKRIVGEAASNQEGPKDGMEGDFKADVAGPDDGIEVPPRADGGEFGGGGGGGSGGGGEAEGLPAWMQDEGGMADPGDAGDGGGDQPGFPSEMETNANYGGDGEGDGDEEDEDDELPITPPDPKKPKKP